MNELLGFSRITLQALVKRVQKAPLLALHCQAHALAADMLPSLNCTSTGLLNC